MGSAESTATLNAGASATWIIGGDWDTPEGYFDHDHQVTIDAHQIRGPSSGGLTVTTLGNRLSYGNIRSRYGVFNDKYSYFVDVTNNGGGPIMYHVRVRW